MMDTAIEFRFEGEDAVDLASQFAELVKERVGLAPAVERGPAGAGAQTRGVDPNLMVAILSLVLTVPSTMLSLGQLTDWLKKKRRVAPAAAAAPPRQSVRISIRGHDLTETMNEEDMKALLELLEQAAGRGGARGERRQ
jgi:hypothetical protein